MKTDAQAAFEVNLNLCREALSEISKGLDTWKESAEHTRLTWAHVGDTGHVRDALDHIRERVDLINAAFSAGGPA